MITLAQKEPSYAWYTLHTENETSAFNRLSIVEAPSLNLITAFSKITLLVKWRLRKPPILFKFLRPPVRSGGCRACNRLGYRRLYNVRWKEAINDLLENIQEEYEPLEENLGEKGIKYERQDQEWFSFYAHLYVKYIQCYKFLEDAYDQLIHPQKRVLLKEMLESTMLRLVEVKSVSVHAT